MRSILEFADTDPAALSSVLAAGADSLILRPAVAARIGERIMGRPRVLVRVDDLDEDPVGDAVAAGADGVLLARTSGVAAIEHLAAMLAVAEARAGLADGAVRIIASIESGAGLLALQDHLGRAHARVAALAWDAEALAIDLGAQSAREPDGAWIEPLAHARTTLLAATAAAGLAAIDTPSDGRNGFAAEAEAARRHGFRAKIATSLEQVAILKAMSAPPAAWPFDAGAAKVGLRRAKGREHDGQSDL